MKVSLSTQTAILQLVDPTCAAAEEHVETRIWNFHFLSVFCQIAAMAYLGNCNRWRNQINPHFSFGNSFNEINIRAHRYPCDYTLRAT